MLHGRQGQIWLDGRPVMDDGLWLDKAYDVLNRGWKSVPVDERPEYWKNY
jgi:aminopeptidase